MTCLECKFCEEWEENPNLLMCMNFECEDYAEIVGARIGNFQQSGHDVCEKYEVKK